MSTFLNNWLERRAMSGAVKDDGVDSYIQDGLIFQLDGLNKGNDATMWKDRKGLASFTFNQHFVNDTIGAQLLGTGEVICNEDFTRQKIITALSHTCEIVFIPDEQNDFMRAYILRTPNGETYDDRQKNDVPSFGFYYNKYLCGDYSLSDYKFGFSTDINFRIASSIGNAAIYNGNIAVKSINDSFYAKRNQFVIGDNNYSAKGLLLSIRLYNRPLSNEEMLYNQQIDNQRFNLGLNI